MGKILDTAIRQAGRCLDTEQKALATLAWHYEHRLEAALEKYRAGVPCVGFTSNTVPYELVRAAGFFPVLLSAPRMDTPQADLFMEPVFETRIRTVFDRLLAGDWSFLSLLIIPRTSEQEYKLYLYLCEVSRQGFGSQLPPVCLFDMLHTRSPRSLRYGMGRMRELERRLSELAGRAIDREASVAAIEESNAARRAIRQLLRLRRADRPRLSAAEALPLIGSWHFMDRTVYAELAETAARVLARREPLTGPRVMVKGTALDRTDLHKAIEAHGAVVVAEDDWWGSRSAGRDVIAGSDPVTGLFRKYYLDAPSPRVFPREASERWFRREVLRGIDGVVFYLPPDDDVLGWDYPHQRAFLQEHGIPSLLVREEAVAEASAELNNALEVFTGRLKMLTQTRIDMGAQS